MTAPDAWPRARHWVNAAACADLGELFIPADGEPSEYSTAKWVCRTKCPVVEQCLASAMAEEGHADHRTRAGVRGGLTPGERARWYRQDARARQAAARETAR
ncbi:WhiB family transcriptional regulator [Streptomyces sp. H27-C3]|uniref:WhiB family transcriptional regulator n=1 Tax=Streptomyces sp. H27-C3 TaxID=3046305 RepID=UPI0024B88526|nr:WhiB family transcriptional regulator [Streptomyces sp. H27-C3]MDJ0460638.1 WhiB family transcriptional regulator [Streptomyces sp. H27-C3]